METGGHGPYVGMYEHDVTMNGNLPNGAATPLQLGHDLGDGMARLRSVPSMDNSEAPILQFDNMLGKKNSQSSSPTSSEEAIHLKKELGLMSGVGMIVGTMIGSGIFVSPKGVLIRSGSVGLSLCVWAGCGVLSMLGALAYMELGTLIPLSGGDYVYLLQAFGGIPSYLFSWTSLLILRPAMLAIICLGFAQYVAQWLTPCGLPPEAAVKLLGTCTILMITVLNCASVKAATSVQNFFMFAKILALGIIIVGGMVNLALGRTENLKDGFKGTTSSASDIALAFYSGLWAYDGWNNLNFVTEELRNPNRNLPLSIIWGIPLVTILYVLTNISYFTIMSPTDLLASDAVAVTWGNDMLGIMAWIIPMSVAFSTFGSANGSCFSASRLCYVAAREGHMVDVLSYVHVRRYTPCPALLFNAIIAIIMVAVTNLEALIDFFSFSAWVFYGTTMLALLVLRYTKPDVHRPIKVPLVIPIFVFAMSCYLVVAPIVDSPQLEYLYAMLFIASGLLFYIPLVQYKVRFKFMAKLTMLLQLILEACPEEGITEEEIVPIGA